MSATSFPYAGGGPAPRQPPITTTTTVRARLTQAQMDEMTLEEFALEVFMRRYERKSVDSKGYADELERINGMLTSLSELYQKLVTLDNKVENGTGDRIPESDLNLVSQINGLIWKNDLQIPLLTLQGFMTVPSLIGAPPMRLPNGQGTTGADLHSAVMTLESKIQQLSTDNQFKSTRASTAIQATAGALEALKSLNDKFHNSLLRILGA